MTPVINPLWFYLMSVADDLDFVASLVLLVGVVALVVMFVISMAVTDYFDEFLHQMKKCKPLIIVTVVTTLVGIITPSSETITKMIIAQNVTYERVEAATDTVETVYNDIMALFEDKGETE